MPLAVNERLGATMRFARIRLNGQDGLAVEHGERARVLIGAEYDLDTILARGIDALRQAHREALRSFDVPLEALEFLPPLQGPGKVICLGLNYRDHADETGMEVAAFPTLFTRFSRLVGHRAVLVKPWQSDQFDFEGELVAVIGAPGKDIPESRALDHVLGYSIFNDGSIRDYQFKTTQWIAGKNFDSTGAFGPWFVPATELPAGASGLAISTRLNGVTVQSANTRDMIFDVAKTVSLLSSMWTLEPGDVLVMGTPAGVGVSRNPPLFMTDGDLCEVEIEGIGLLSNPVVAAPPPACIDSVSELAAGGTGAVR